MRGGAESCNGNGNGLLCEHRSPAQGSRPRNVKELLALWMERNVRRCTNLDRTARPRHAPPAPRVALRASASSPRLRAELLAGGAGPSGSSPRLRGSAWNHVAGRPDRAALREKPSATERPRERSPRSRAPEPTSAPTRRRTAATGGPWHRREASGRGRARCARSRASGRPPSVGSARRCARVGTARRTRARGGGA